MRPIGGLVCMISNITLLFAATSTCLGSVRSFQPKLFNAKIAPVEKGTCSFFSKSAMIRTLAHLIFSAYLPLNSYSCIPCLLENPG